MKTTAPDKELNSKAAAQAQELYNASASYYINAIDTALENYRLENNIKDFKEIKKPEWTAVLIYIYNQVFKPLRTGQGIKKSKLLFTDEKTINKLCDYYIYMCLKYNKPVSIIGYSYLTGISYSTIEKYSNNPKYVNTKYYIDVNDSSNSIYTQSEIEKYKKIYPNADVIELPKTISITISQKLRQASEEALTDLALDGSVMALAVGKIKHGWIEGGLQQKQAELLDNFTSPAELLDNYKPQAIADK